MSFSSRRTRASEPCRRGVSRLKLICRTCPFGHLDPWHPLLARARMHAPSRPTHPLRPTLPVSRAYVRVLPLAHARAVKLTPSISPPQCRARTCVCCQCSAHVHRPSDWPASQSQDGATSVFVAFRAELSDFFCEHCQKVCDEPALGPLPPCPIPKQVLEDMRKIPAGTPPLISQPIDFETFEQCPEAAEQQSAGR